MEHSLRLKHFVAVLELWSLFFALKPYGGTSVQESQPFKISLKQKHEVPEWLRRLGI